MEPLKFYDLRKKQPFTTTEYTVETKEKNGKLRYFAVTTSPAGTKSYRIISKTMYEDIVNMGEDN